MAITIQCDCGKKYRVPESAIGKSAKCKSCGNSITIQVNSPAPDPFAVTPVSTSAPGAVYPMVPTQPAPEANMAVPVDGIRQIQVHAPDDQVKPAWITDVQDELDGFINASPDVFRQVQIQVELATLPEVSGSLGPGIGLNSTGSVNGQPFQFQTAHRGGGSSAEAELSMLTGGFIGLLLHWIGRKIRGNKTVVPVGKGAIELLKKCKFDLVNAVGRAAGYVQSSAARKWNRYKLASCIIFVLSVFVLTGLVTLGPFAKQMVSTISGVATLLFGAVMFSAPLMFAVWALGLLMMPATFFERDPSGRRALSFSGAKSIGGMRAIAAFSFLVLSGLYVGLVIVLITVRG